MALLVPACLFLSHGLGGAGLPAAKSSSLYKDVMKKTINRLVLKKVR